MQKNFRQKILVMGILLGTFFSSLDQTIVGMSLPRIISELHGLGIMVWVTIAYLITSTTIIPIAGKLADLLGRRIMYVLGIIIFMIGSMLCGFSQNMLQLIICRGIQGLGGGMIMPVSLTIIGDIFQPRESARWQGILNAVFALSTVVGPPLGGFIVDNFSWRWLFFINFPVGVMAACAIFAGLRQEKIRQKKPAIDYAGIIAFVSGVVCLLLGLSLGGGYYPWNSWQIIVLFTVFFVLTILFLFIESRAREPLLSLELFRNRTFIISNIIGILMGVGLFSCIMFLPLFLQAVLGLSATETGYLMLPMMMALVLSSIISGRLVTRFSFRSVFIAGISIMAIAFFMFNRMTADTAVIAVLIYLIILGLGMGLIMPLIIVAVQVAFPAEKKAVVTAVTTFFRSIGGTLGLAVFGAVLNNYSSASLNKFFFPAAEQLAREKSPMIMELIRMGRANPQNLFNSLLDAKTLSAITPQSKAVLLPLLKSSLADSLQFIFFIAMIVILGGIGFCLFLGKSRIGKSAQVIESSTEFKRYAVPDRINTSS